MRGMIKHIDWYIIKKFLGAYFLTMLLIIGVAIVIDITEKMDDFYNERLGIKTIILDYYVHFVPYYANLFSSVFTFISAIFVTSKMAGNTEIIAILGSGISYRRMLRPYLHGALILALGIFVVGNFVIPRSNIQLKKFEDKYIHTHHRNYYSNLHFQTAKGVQVTAFSYDVGENSAIFFQQDSYSPSGDLKVRICANKIIYDTLNDLWTAQGMTQRVFDGDKETLKTHAKAKIKLPLKPDDFNEAAKEISTMNSIELYHHIQHEAMRGSGAVTAAKLEYYQRLLNPLAFLVMTFIGVAISSRKVRGGIGLHLAIGITLAFGFIVLMRVCSVFAENGNLQPFLAVLLPQLIFGIAAIYLIKKAPK